MIYFCAVKRIYLHRAEKVVLRWVALGKELCPADYPRHTYNAAVRTLCDKGFVRAAFVEGGDVEAVSLSDFGKLYMAENPRLRNPIRWDIVSAVCLALSLVIAVVSLFIACSSIK